MTIEQIIAAASNLGLGGIVFIIWYFDAKKMDSMKRIVEEQIEEKRQMRDDRLQLVNIVEKHATLIGRTVSILDRVEQRMDRKVATIQP